MNLEAGNGTDLAAGLVADHGTAIVLISDESIVSDRPHVAALRPFAVLKNPSLPTA